MRPSSNRSSQYVLFGNTDSAKPTTMSLTQTPSPTPKLPAMSISHFTNNVRQDFNSLFIKTEKKRKKFQSELSDRAWIERLHSILPITKWLPEYDVKQNLFTDVLVGITIAIFQVPQSMGYSLIAQVPPVYVLYSAFFPSLLYTFLGTGMHSAFGPFAIVSAVMTGDIVVSVMHELNKDPNKSRLGSALIDKYTINLNDFSTRTTTSIASNAGSVGDEFPGLKNVDIAIMVGLIIGVYIFVFGILRLGFISNFMSQELINGFITSASILVFISQLRYLLGVDLDHFSGPFNVFHTLFDAFKKIKDANLATLIISTVCLAILLFFKLFVNQWTAKLGMRTPFPIELLVVICGTLVSHYMDLKSDPYNVKIVGTIASKFPAPQLPELKLLPFMWVKCIPIAIVGYSITLSVAQTYGRKHGYNVDPNQEMIAMGATNILSSFFKCIPSAASLPRSALQETAGGKTQIVSLVNSCCIVIVILSLGQYVQELPLCVLGSCISVALISLLNKFYEIKRIWKISKLDGTTWIITFGGVLIFCVEYGIYMGIICSVITLIYKAQGPKTYLLGNINQTDIYVPINKFGKVKEVDGIKIFQFCGPLNFSNTEFFFNELEMKCGVNVTNIKKQLKSNNIMKERTIDQISAKNQMIKISMSFDDYPTHIIIDCSMFTCIDFSGITTLKKTIDSYEEIGIKIVLAGLQVHLENMIMKDDFFDEIKSDHMFNSINEAVLNIHSENTDIKEQNQVIHNNIQNTIQNNIQNNFQNNIISSLSEELNKSTKNILNNMTAKYPLYGSTNQRTSLKISTQLLVQPVA